MSPQRLMRGRKRRWTRSSSRGCRGSIRGPGGAPMNRREESWCRMRGQQRAARAAAEQQEQQERQQRSSNTEDKQVNMHEPRYLESWIVNLLLEYTAAETREDDQLGHILKVLEETKALPHNEESPVATLRIADGHHYIPVVVTAKAVQRTKCPLLQSGFSNVTGQFIVLRNYRVCFKESPVVEDCEFYLLLEHFRVIPMKRQEMEQLDCNREPSVLQKIKELWMKSLALQPWSSSEPSSVSDVLREIKQDQLSTLKQNVEDCISLLDPGQMLDSEQLAVYPDTKWQKELRNDKKQQDTFTVPSELLMISDEDETALHKACSAPAESENHDDSLENPWDMFPRMTSSSSTDISGTAPSLPNTQQVLLANTAEEEEIPCSSSCTPDLLEPQAHVPHGGSDQASSGKTVLPTSRQSANQETIAACEEHRVSDIDDNIPCVEPLKNPPSDTVCLPPSADLSARKDLFLDLSSDSMEEDHLAHLQRNMAAVVKETRDRDIQTSRRYFIGKRKKLMSDEEELIEISSSPDCMSHNTPEQPSSAFPRPTNLESQKSPLVRLVSLPKKSRVKEIQKSHQQMPAQVRCTNGLRETRWEEDGAATRRPGKHLGHKQRDCRRRASFQVASKPVTPELRSKVCSTRISRALLGWARWVFSSVQKQ